LIPGHLPRLFGTAPPLAGVLFRAVTAAPILILAVRETLNNGPALVAGIG